MSVEGGRVEVVGWKVVFIGKTSQLLAHVRIVKESDTAIHSF